MASRRERRRAAQALKNARQEAKSPNAGNDAPKEKSGRRRRKRRRSSRGKRQNKKSQHLHAATKLDQAAGKPTVESENPVHQNAPPEDFAPGPSVELLDSGGIYATRDLALVDKMESYPHWQIPDQAYSVIPALLFEVAGNIGEVKEGDKTIKRVGAGSYTVGQRLTATRLIERFDANNVRKMTAVDLDRLKEMSDAEQTTVTADRQRAVVLAAIYAELERREQGGTVPSGPARLVTGGSESGDENDAT